MMNTYMCVYIYIYINNIFSFYPWGLSAKTFTPIALTPITADRYVIANGHYVAHARKNSARLTTLTSPNKSTL